MKLFTVTAHSVVVGMRVYKDPYPHVRMGEPSENQTAAWIPLHDQWPVPIQHRLERASIRPNRKKKPNGPTHLLVPERDDDKPDHALVLVDIRGKEGGEAIWTHARKSRRHCPMRGMNGGEYIQCPLCHTDYVNGRHPNSGDFMDYAPFPPRKVNIVVKKWIRYVPSHPEWGGIENPPWTQIHLLELHPGAVFRVHRGYDKGIANERIIRWTGEDLELGTARELLEERFVSAEEGVDALYILETRVS